MKHKHILALDPSGAYMEGKGTTGWCILNAATHIIELTGTITAVNYKSDVEYWDAHLDMIRLFDGTYEGLAIVMEDYLLYAAKAEAHINSRFETSQLIGVIKHYAYKKGIPIYIQRATDVKNRWSNKVLLYKNIIKKRGKHMVTHTGYSVCRHELDAVRHAVHYDTFYNVR